MYLGHDIHISWHRLTIITLLAAIPWGAIGIIIGRYL